MRILNVVAVIVSAFSEPAGRSNGCYRLDADAFDTDNQNSRLAPATLLRLLENCQAYR